MARADANGIEIEYETFGDRADPTLLLVNGLGGQLLSWDAPLCEGFVDRGFHVVRFDNRDVGLSTRFEPEIDVMASVLALFGGEEIEVPYLMSDMAADAVGLLDALQVDRAHVVGQSMGGMIVQTMAIEHRDRVASMTSIMSTTGDPDVGQPDPSVLGLLLAPAARSREEFVAAQLQQWRLIGSPEYFDEARVRARSEAAFDRSYWPRGVGHQLLAILASGSRSDRLRELDLDTLVIHGGADRLVDPSGGERTAECIAGAELMVLEGMGHDLPPEFWARIIAAVTALAARSAANA
jgi:pimeloyl-ACP methyl ester carboxylesterase